MANIVPFEKIQVPAHLQNRNATANAVFAAALSMGASFPTIGMKGTRFAVKIDGEETVLPTIELSAILLGAKASLDKNWYAEAYDPNSTEIKAPDCFSRDGVKPESSCTSPQSASCAACPQNQYGSGTDQNGNPTKGKACSDTKQLAVCCPVNPDVSIFGIKIPPASLKAFAFYVKETSRRGVDLTTAVTVIGFDPAYSYPVYTFQFGGFLSEKQLVAIDALKGSLEVEAIVGVTAGSEKPVEKPVEAADPFAALGGEEAPVKKPKAAPKKVVDLKPVEEVTEEEVTENNTDNELADLAAQLGIDL